MGDVIKIGYLGYKPATLDFLKADPRYDLRYFFAPKSRMNREVEEAADRYKGSLTFRVVNGNEDLKKAFAECKDVECFLMNACPIILKKEVLDEMKVFNIHPGDLATNRGHHPHLWTVRLGEPKTKIVLHEVGLGIDEGNVICSKEIDVPPDADAGHLLSALFDVIPLLLDRLYAYLRKECEPEGVVMGGTYRQTMTYRDYQIFPEEASNSDFVITTERKIRCSVK